MNQIQFSKIYIIFMILILLIAGFVGYKHLEYIEIMRYSPCDLCITCPNNIIEKINWTFPVEYLNFSEGIE